MVPASTTSYIIAPELKLVALPQSALLLLVDVVSCGDGVVGDGAPVSGEVKHSC